MSATLTRGELRAVPAAPPHRRPASLTRLGRLFPWRVFLLAPSTFILLSLMGACLILLRYSVNSWDPIRTMVPDLTGSNYAALFRDTTVRRALGNTIRISVIVTAMCLVLGYPAAYAIARSRRRNLLVGLLITPLMVDVLLRAYGWLVLLSPQGLVNTAMTTLGIWSAPRRLIYTEGAVVLELIHEYLPFMVLPIAAVLERIDGSLHEAAMNLRAGPIRTFLHITLPLSVPGVVAGTLLTFGHAMSAFVAPLVVGGGNIMTMTMLIYQQMLAILNWPLGSAQSITLVLAVLGLLLVYARQLRGRSGQTQ